LKKSKKLRRHIWFYFMLFTTLILVALYLFLFVFLRIYYEKTKTKDIKKSAEIITANFGEKGFGKMLDNLAFENNMCIAIVDKYGEELYSLDMMAGNCLIHSDHGARLFGWRNELLDSQNGVIYHTINEEQFNSKMLIYGTIIGSKKNVVAYVFLNCSLEPIESTTRIIKRQFMCITLVILGLAFVITLFISKKISSPIVKITASAQKFAKGDYSVKFDGGDYLEAQQLATVLNYAGKEISKVDALRRELISNISHDLRTPLTIIKAYAEMIRDLSGDNPPKREQHIKVIVDEADRLTSLVNGILALSDRYKIFEERDCYKFTFEKSQDAVVNADIEKIEQVLYNFINNAVNFTGEDKTVTIRQIVKEKSVRIEIADSGDGIEKEKLPLIFDRYYRDAKSEREVVGTGLGLSIIKEILRLHGFPFGVQSEVGKGSVFWFEILR